MQRTILTHILMLLIGAGITWAYVAREERTNHPLPFDTEHTTTDVGFENREKFDDWSFVSPLLTCGYERDEVSTQRLRETRDAVAAYLEKQRSAGVVQESGIYFRALNDGGWFGLNERSQFTPGSLLKVPLALSLMRTSETNPEFTTGVYEYTGGIPDIPTAFPPTKKAEIGKGYTFPELLELSLVYSDNIATILLAQLIDRTTLDAAYSDLGIEAPGTGDTYTTTVRTYASFFRILYNGTYLSHKNSEYILSTLSKSAFTEGIAAGVPAGTVVAHKFGEREYQGEPSQLHDCGIVYTDQPYILCVMLRGKEMEKLPPVIADVSRIVYDRIAKQ